MKLEQNLERLGLGGKQMSINDFIKEIRALFGNIEFKATSKQEQVFKSRRYDEENAKAYAKKQTRSYKRTA